LSLFLLSHQKHQNIAQEIRKKRRSISVATIVKIEEGVFMSHCKGLLGAYLYQIFVLVSATFADKFSKKVK